jgi:hypothetical protein
VIHMRISRLLAGTTVMTAAALVGLPLAAQAAPAGVECHFSGTGTEQDCGVAFTHAGGTVTVTADIGTGAENGSWWIANSDTYEVPCESTVEAAAPVATWSCTLPEAGRYYFGLEAFESYGAPGHGSVSW